MKSERVTTKHGKKASKRSTEQLQQVFDLLGEFGGVIETKSPEAWWSLDVEVIDIDKDKKDVVIGVFKNINGDIMFDPQFELTLTMQGDKIVEAVIHQFVQTTLVGTTVVSDDDMICFYGIREKAPKGLRDLFEGFMKTVTEIGPYLTDPKSVTRYTKTLAD